MKSEVVVRMLGAVEQPPPKSRTDAGLVPVLRDYVPQLHKGHALLVVNEHDSARVSRALTILSKEPETDGRKFVVRRVHDGIMVWRER